MSLHLQVSQPERVYLSLKPSSDISRASSFLGGMAEFSTSPTSTVLEQQLFVRHTALWTGILLFKQILCKGELGVCTTLLGAILCATSLSIYDSLC